MLSRRRLVRLVGTGLLAGSAGCVQNTGGTDNENGSELGNTRGRSNESENQPGQSAELRFGLSTDEVDCPLDDGIKYAVPTVRFDPDEVPMRLEKNGECVELPRDEISFTLTNGTDEEFNINFYA